jgi:spore coat protein U-like protein
MMVSGMGAGFASPAQPYRVWGLLPDNLANKGAAVGAYADTLTVTLTY